MGERHVEPGKLYVQPLREVNTRESRNITGFVCSRKMPGQAIVHESQNELAFIKRAEIDPRVSEIYAQPILIRYRDANGAWADAFPDFIIVVDGVAEIHEVKPDRQFGNASIRDKLKRIADASEQHGYLYSAALASQLHRSRDSQAIEAAWRRLKTEVHPITLRAVEDLLEDGSRSIGDLIAATTRYGTSVATFHAMLAMGRIRADMTTPADLDMVVHPRSSNAWFERLIPFNDPREATR